MITYNLTCSHGHEFEGWFKDSAAYDLQEASGTLDCPLCGDYRIAKAIMGPSVKTSVTKAKGRSYPSVGKQETVRQFASGIRKFVEENAEYVGRNFAEEARKIHYGETDERHIYGESTLAEAKELIEEGIDVAPLPPEPEDLN